MTLTPPHSPPFYGDQVNAELRAALAAVLQQMAPSESLPAAFETPKLAKLGDLACTAAMTLAKRLKSTPRELALKLVQGLNEHTAVAQWVERIEVVGPGFINLFLKPAAQQRIVHNVLQAGSQFGVVARADQPAKLLVEFVSANPTGPLHVGHGRQAALGDALCNLYATQGFAVHREFYYNDAGVQIDTLAASVQLRAKGFAPGCAEWPEAAYNGEYIADIAQDFLAKKTVASDDRSTSANGNADDLANIREFAVAYLRREQDLDLQAFALKFDEFYLESSLYTSGRVAQTVQALVDSGHTYEEGGALWLKSTDFGDDKDRVMRKSDGGYTYFVPDVAYHLAKWQRGFERVINIQGTDHHGTIARVRAGVQAAGKQLGLHITTGYPDYVLHTMVRVMRGGEEVKISKRAGSYVTLRDLIEWTSVDAVRFFLLSRKPDTEYVFDVDLAIAKNNDNPVYYVQYAHARICSVLASWGGDAAQLPQADLSSLNSEAAFALMRVLKRYPDVLANAAADFAAHDVCFYLRELAAAYHSYYDAERILVDDSAQKLARLALVQATAQVLRNGLGVLGVSAPQKM